MSAMFDPVQQRLLEAMGYQLWQQAAPGSGASSPAGVAPVPPATVSPGTIAAAPMPTSTATAAAGAPVVPAVTGRAATPADRVWCAVLAAAALSAERAEHNRLRRASSGVPFEYLADELWIDPQALARDPRAKRTLWKTLRALRRAEVGRRA